MCFFGSASDNRQIDVDDFFANEKLLPLDVLLHGFTCSYHLFYYNELKFGQNYIQMIQNIIYFIGAQNYH